MLNPADPRGGPDRTWTLVLDAAHLWLLLLLTAAAVWWAFRRGERRWLRLEGLP